MHNIIIGRDCWVARGGEKVNDRNNVNMNKSAISGSPDVWVIVPDSVHWSRRRTSGRHPDIIIREHQKFPPALSRTLTHVNTINAVTCQRFLNMFDYSLFLQIISQGSRFKYNLGQCIIKQEDPLRSYSLVSAIISLFV